MNAIALGGMALHAGVASSIVLRATSGPTVLAQGGASAPLDALRVMRTDHGVGVTDPTGRMAVDLVEHLLAALGGMGIGGGVCVTVRGPEIPLLDGGARRIAEALVTLGVASSGRRARIARAWEMRTGGSTYAFMPGARTTLEVRVAFDHPLVAVDRASWDGEASSFLQGVAPARTFGFVRDAEALAAAGRARGVDPGAVVVLCDDGTTLSCPPPEPDECARHKLLDLIGDLTLWGGVPLGRVTADRPGHRATARVMAAAIAAGVIEPA